MRGGLRPPRQSFQVSLLFSYNLKQIAAELRSSQRLNRVYYITQVINKDINTNENHLQVETLFYIIFINLFDTGIMINNLFF